MSDPGSWSKGIRGAVDRFKSGEMRMGVAALVSGTAIAQLIVVASSPLLTRLYSPAALGEFTVAFSLMLILSSISTLSYDYAIPLPGDARSAANVLALSLTLIALIGIATAVVIHITGAALLTWFGAGSLASVPLLIVLGQVGAAAVGALRQWAVRVKAFPQIAVNSLIQALVLVGAQLAFGVAALGATGLLAAAAIGMTAGWARLARVAWRSDADAIRGVSVRGIVQAAVRYRRFAFLSTPSVLLNSIGVRGPILVLTAIFGVTVGGQYALAERVIALPASLIAGAVGQVYTAEAAIAARDDPERLRELFIRTTKTLAATALGPAILIAVASPLLFGFIFGEEWTEAGWFVTALTPWYFAYAIANPTGSTLDVLERQDLFLGRELLRIALLSAGAVTIILLSLPPIAAVATIGLAGTVTYAAYAYISWHAIVVTPPAIGRSSGHTDPDARA